MNELYIEYYASSIARITKKENVKDTKTKQKHQKWMK